MPLSEEELRLLEQMERALVAEDPKLASTMRGTRLRQRARRQVLLGALVFVIGVAVLMTGAVIRNTPLGIVGFVVMLGSAYVSLSSWRGQTGSDTAAAPTSDPGKLRVVPGGKGGKGSKGSSRVRSPKQAKGGSMMERFEERWRRRREQNGNGGL